MYKVVWLKGNQQENKDNIVEIRLKAFGKPPSMPIHGALKVLRNNARRTNVRLAESQCISCAYCTGEWPEGTAVLKNYQGVPLVHCPPCNDSNWHVPPMNGCSRYIPDVTISVS